MIRCDNKWQDVARCDNILRNLGAKFKVVIATTFLSKMGIKCDKM